LFFGGVTRLLTNFWSLVSEQACDPTKKQFCTIFVPTPKTTRQKPQRVCAEEK